MATASREKVLQDALVQAVFYGHLKAVEEAGKGLKEHYAKFTKTTPPKLKTTGPQVLDFIVAESRLKSMKRV